MKKKNYKYSLLNDTNGPYHDALKKEERIIARKYHALIFLVSGMFFTCLVMFTWCLFSEEKFAQEMIIHNGQWLSPEASHYRKFYRKLQDEKNLSPESLAKFVNINRAEKYPRTEINLDSGKTSGREEPQTPVEAPLLSQCDVVNINMRFDCFPSGDSTRQACEERGCCWKEIQKDEIPQRDSVYSKLRPSHVKRSLNNTAEAPEMNVPFCYYPRYYSLYKAADIHRNKTGISGTLTQTHLSGYPNDISTLRLDVRYETCSRVRIRITDGLRRRWETPIPLIPEGSPGCHGVHLYQVDIEPTGEIIVSRGKTAEPLFDTRNAAPLIYSDQFIQLSTKLPSPFIYGLGQHLNGLLLDTYWKKRELWNADAIPTPDANLYGSHPFYMVMEPEGNAHGVFLLNSNAIEVILQPTPALTFRTIGGILDFYVFLGPTPDQVISQYTEVIGRPFLPPYWSLGYHQCRFGYKTLKQMKEVWNRTREAGIPFDVQWSDIDYMDNRNDFTYDNVSYAGLPEFVDELHKDGMHFVVIVDPGISAGEEKGKYPPYDLGIKSDVFVKNSSGDLFIGKVWNTVETVFPDFTKPNSVIYWNYLIDTFRKQVPFDGLWIDMNEPSNFWNGQKDGCPQNSSLEHPVYTPGVTGGLLSYKTLCMTAQHYFGTHFDTHNLYGISEVISTNFALRTVHGIDHPFIISRSSFPGIGAYGGHWTGDVVSDWFNLWKSVGDVLTTNLLGIPMVGADICGFNGNTTAPLCNRWMQLGAFYPFSRNHNSDENIAQDPVAMGDLVVKSSRKALLQRYTLLPFLHTLFVKAHETGIPVARPLFFKYPHDSETYSIDTQFLWGNDLMIVPVLEEKATSVVAYFPEGRWYDWYTGELYSSTGKMHWTLSAPLDTIPLFVSGGSILPCQNPANTTTDSRKNPFGLVIAEDGDSYAAGELAWNRPGDSDYVQWKFKELNGRFVSTPSFSKENDENLVLDWIKYFGIPRTVISVEVNGKSVPYKFSAVTKVLLIENLALNFKERIEVIYLG